MKKFARYINIFFVVVPMTISISIASLILNSSYEKKDCLFTFIKSWLLILPIAYILALIIIPLANRLTSSIFRNN